MGKKHLSQSDVVLMTRERYEQLRCDAAFPLFDGKLDSVTYHGIPCEILPTLADLNKRVAALLLEKKSVEIL